MKIGSIFALKCDITSESDLNSLLPCAHDLCGPITSAVRRLSVSIGGQILNL